MSLPKSTIDAAGRRRALLSRSDWLTAEEAERRLREIGSIRELQDARRLLGVWDPEHRHWRYPAFQFSSGPDVRAVVADLLNVLPPGNGSGWSQVEWLYSPHPRTGARPPIELIESEPDRVLEAARRQFASHPDASW